MELKLRDLWLIIGLSKDEFLQIPNNSMFPGMARSLTLGEARVLAILNACIKFLNKNNILKPEALESLQIKLTQSDSDPEVEESEWVLNSED